MKLAIGTVQFGIRYGINNSEGIPGNAEIHNIFTVATNAGIRMIDTALGYGNSEERVSPFADIFNIVSKFSGVKTDEELLQQFETSCTHIGASAIYGYLAHNADNLIATPELWQTLQKLKEESRVQKIGYSLYTPAQLEKLLELQLVPDLVQIPYSLLDRKFEPYLALLKKLGTEIHVRSVFLQGLYFMDPLALPEKLMPLQPELSKLHNLCLERNISIGALAINFIAENPLVDYVVIGVEKAAQLEQNIQKVEEWKTAGDVFGVVRSLNPIQKELLNPVNW